MKYDKMLYRKMLHPDWTKLDYKTTDFGLKKEVPNRVKSYDENRVISLNKDVKIKTEYSLEDIIMKRRSHRKYTDQSLTLEELSYLCKYTGILSKVQTTRVRGVIPTGGGLKACEMYVYVHHVNKLKQGLYYYNPQDHSLVVLDQTITPKDIDQSLNGQLRGASVVFIWSAVPYRSEYKYEFTAHKMIAMEAGHACQNLYLACEAIDFGTVAIAAYDQNRFDETVGLDGEDEFVIYAATVGKVD